jgi:hypothetical protein
MSHEVARQLSQVLEKIDRPGSFCMSGSAPTVLPGLEVAGLGPIGLPLTPKQANELKKHCEQAPYGKGEETVVDTSVRRVWRLTPDRFTLTNPDWQPFLQQTVARVQEELGLGKQKLESHLYDLLLYEPGSFFLPHRDGEKLDRMVATLVVVLPSSFQGGELVVRHEGQEQTIDFGGDDSRFRIHFAAFYADCEHEIRPLREGHRLCLVYNLTLAKSKKRIGAPRLSEHVERIAEILGQWADSDATPRKLAATLEHQYTQEGLVFDALKGVDRARAAALFEGARQAGCQALLALLTLHESGSAEYAGGGYGGGYRRRGRWYDEEEEEEEDASDYEMVEVIESSLTAEHWSDAAGKRLPLGKLDVEEDEVLDPEALQSVTPEEEFEGYTGNAGMTLDRWYRHAAIILWPNSRQFDILCDAGPRQAAEALGLLVNRWQHAGKKEASALRAECVQFAGTIIARWPEKPYAGYADEKAERCPLFKALAALAEPELIRKYLAEVLPRDATVDPGKSLVTMCQKHGWATFQQELEAAFARSTSQTLPRNVHLLEHLCLATPRKKTGWAELCQTLARSLVTALERIDQEVTGPEYNWQARDVPRAAVLARLTRPLLATEQEELLSRLVDHALARPETYPLTKVHVAALTALAPWLAKNVKTPSPALSRWLASCREQLEGLTAETPQPPADFRRDARVSCGCANCTELKRFLRDPREQVHRFRAAQAERSHLADQIRQSSSDLDLRTEERGRPYTLICTKNTASYKARLARFHEDQEHLADIRSIEASVPK